MAGNNCGILLSPHGAYCTRPRGITLIEFTQIKRFSRWSGGGGWSLLLQAKSLKTNLSDHQARDRSDQMVLVTASREAGLCERRPNSRLQSQMMLKWELENNSWQSRSLTKTGWVRAKTRVNLLFLVGSGEWRVVVDEDDDEWEPIKLILGPCDSDSGY